MEPIFPGLRQKGFDLAFTYHADAILRQDFAEAVSELDRIVSAVSIPVVELVRGGGGEAQVTQRLRHVLSDHAWSKRSFKVEKRINDKTTFSQSHEVDHVKACPAGAIALEIEWNNKDPFFDRDLENFNRLHVDGGISLGIVVTRGQTLQEGLEDKVRSFATDRNITSFSELSELGVVPTQRQKDAVEKYQLGHACTFAQAWAACFIRDKFGTATTHWAKLKHRLDRGVGSPCPIVAIGIPLSCVTD